MHSHRQSPGYAAAGTVKTGNQLESAKRGNRNRSELYSVRRSVTDVAKGKNAQTYRRHSEMLTGMIYPIHDMKNNFQAALAVIFSNNQPCVKRLIFVCP